MMSELAVGIDLGTSNSCVAVARGGEVEVLANAYGERTTASVVAFHDDGMIEVGNRAKANIIHDPENTIYSAKRLIGRYFFSEEVKKAQAVCSYEIVEGPSHTVRVMAREEEFSLPEVSAMVLREMKQIAEQRLGHEVTKAVITVPAYFNDNQRQATKDAGKIAGLEVLRILNEPTAAALAYGFGKGLNQRVAVYDLGGGTFDVSVLEIGKDIFEVLSTCGDTFLGGDDFDDRLIDLLADEFVAKEGINLRQDPFAFEKIKVAAENAKKAFSRDDHVEIRIPDIAVGEDGVPRSLERTMTQAEYAALVQDLVMRTFKVCDEAMQQADLTTRDLDGVILVGGPTRLPIIRQAVADYFQQVPKDDVDPDEVVACGAAIHAASLTGTTATATNDDAFLLDVTPLDLRIGVAGGLAEPVIERNTPVPIEQTRRFTTTRDFQESVQIKVYQGGERQADANEMLGQFEFSGFKKARRGDVAIDVTFEINADGIVNVTAFDPDTEQRASTRITLSSGLSDAELDAIIENDKTARVQTAAAPGAAAAALPAAEDADLATLDAASDILEIEDASRAPALEPAPPVEPPPALARESAVAGE
ncbi:MAG: Hsp70 family protein, partial [Myxococcales bacterium]|nr:Hsp70 family protein [Myxococcales bacterium]